jgi:hypothetical protein
MSVHALLFSLSTMARLSGSAYVADSASATSAPAGPGTGT